MAGDTDRIPIDHDGEVASTDKATCYLIDGEECWFPDSLHEDDSESNENRILVEEWFATKEGYT